jgi:Alginate export
MQTTTRTLLLFLITGASSFAQYVPPSPAVPGPGAIDDYLKTAAPDLIGWDFGVNDRLRSENKADGGTTHAGSNFDFSAASPTDNSNDYWMNRLFLRADYKSDWFTFFVEGRSSYSFGDDRFTATSPGKNLAEDDGPLQLQMAYLGFGNLKNFPVTVKVGRQELIYGDQRLVGNAFWLNIPHTFDAVKVRYQDSFFGVDVFESPGHALGCLFRFPGTLEGRRE